MLNIKNKLGKALSLFIVLVLAMSVCLGLVACNDNTHKHEDADNDGYCDSCSQWIGEGEDPADHVHTFDTTVWEHDATAHWHPATCGHTDQKGNRARHTFGDDRKCTECKYEQAAEIYIVGQISGQPNSHFPSYYKQTGGSISQIREDCILMERGEDGVFFAEVYLLPRDEFAIYDYNLDKQYPANTGSGYPTLQVEAENTYLITYTLDAATPEYRVHDHKFADKYGFDADNHWKVCTDRDATPDTTKEPHDFTNGDCVCGAKKPAECQHPKGFAFDYSSDALPVVNESGGILQKKCPECGKEEEVSYDVGVDIAGNTKVSCSGSIRRAPVNISVGQSLYVADGAIYFQMAITEAGTYTINVEAVNMPSTAIDGNGVLTLGAFGLSTSQDTTTTKPADLIFETSVKNAEDVSKYNITVNGKRLTEYTALVDGNTDIKSISFTVSAEDLTAGTLYAKIVIGVEAPAATFYKTGELRYFVSTKKESA